MVERGSGTLMRIVCWVAIEPRRRLRPPSVTWNGHRPLNLGAVISAKLAHCRPGWRIRACGKIVTIAGLWGSMKASPVVSEMYQAKRGGWLTLISVTGRIGS